MENLSLHGLRIWISGSIPSNDDTQKEQVSKCVAALTRAILKNGGCVAHGCHPSITEIIGHEAIFHKNQTGNNTKELVFYFVSRFFISDYKSDLPRWEKYANVIETPAINDEKNARDASLKVMRDYLCARSDVIIAIGGDTWDELPARAGVAAEVQMAIENNLPCFVLGGFGGSAERIKPIIIENHYSLKNGLDSERNIQLATCDDPDKCTTIVIEQLSRLPIAAVTTKISGGTFRILCLDGGGVKGVYTASFLKSLESHFDCRIADHFDLIAGTSTGGIIAIALAARIPASDVLKFYKEKGPVIFPAARIVNRFFYRVKHLFCAKYSINKLHEALSSILNKKSKKTTLKDLCCRVVIPTFHPLSGKSLVFRTPHCEVGQMRKDTNVVDVAIATAAAPTFFGPATLIDKQVASDYIDGGVWANTPSLVAIVEATKHLNIPINKIDILSIGTTEEVKTFSDSTRGILSWAAHLVNLLLHAQQESTLQLTKYMLGEARVLRVNHNTPKGKYSLDNSNEINSLASLGASEAENTELINQIKSRFLNGIKAQPPKW